MVIPTNEQCPKCGSYNTRWRKANMIITGIVLIVCGFFFLPALIVTGPVGLIFVIVAFVLVENKHCRACKQNFISSQPE